MKLTGWMETLFHDLRFGVRQLVRNPVFAVVSVLSLALGIGANTAIFSIFNAVMFKALPIRDPNKIVLLTNPNASGISIGQENGERSLVSYAEFAQLRDRTKLVMSGICASQSSLDRWEVRVAGNSQEEARGRLVSEEYFSVLGVEPAIGRFFTLEDVGGGPGKAPFAVISYDYWLRRFGGNASVIGTSIRLYGATLTVIGVAAPGFQGETVGEYPDLWVPMMMEPLVKPGRDWLHEDSSHPMEKVMWLRTFGRLKPGISQAQAQAEINILFKGIVESDYSAGLAPDARKRVLNQYLLLHEARTGVFGGRDEFSQYLLILLGAAALVLLISCANVANLLLARASVRYKEVGVRLSLGATRARLVRQLLTESVLLSAFGGIVGVLFALGAARLLVFYLSNPKNPLQLSTNLDLSVLLFTAGITLITGVVFGLAPAVRGTRVDINGSLRDSGRGVTSSASRLTLAKSFVIAQVAISLLLIVSAGLFLRTLWNLKSVYLGYPKENLLLVRVDGLTAGYKNARLLTLYRDIQDRIRSLPGVHSVTYSENGLFSGTESGDEIEVEGFKPENEDDRGSRYDQIGPGYFSTVGIPMKLGREAGQQDTFASSRICIVNEAFAKHFFHEANPIGRHVVHISGSTRTILEVVGVAKNARDHQLRGAVPERFYLPLDQMGSDTPGSVNFEIRVGSSPYQMLSTVRKAILELNPDVPIVSSRSLDELLDLYNAQPRMIARLSFVFGIFALILAATGLYGVLSYGVTRRTNEIGIRMALGAGKSRMVFMIMKETSVMILIGVVFGIVATAAITRLIAARLYGLSALDSVTIMAAVLVLSFVALLASYIPAMRAARVNPMTALRHE
jgi:predicted permease